MSELEEVTARWFTGIWTGKYNPVTDALACCGKHWRYWIQVEGVGDCPDCQAGLPAHPNAIPEKYKGPILPKEPPDAKIEIGKVYRVREVPRDDH